MNLQSLIAPGGAKRTTQNSQRTTHNPTTHNPNSVRPPEHQLVQPVHHARAVQRERVRPLLQPRLDVFEQPQLVEVRHDLVTPAQVCPSASRDSVYGMNGSDTSWTMNSSAVTRSMLVRGERYSTRRSSPLATARSGPRTSAGSRFARNSYELRPTGDSVASSVRRPRLAVDKPFRQKVAVLRVIDAPR